jgi:hypothetical protein
VIAPQSFMLATCYNHLLRMQRKLPRHFGLVRLEEIFAEMEKHSYRYPPIVERWGDYTDLTP